MSISGFIEWAASLFGLPPSCVLTSIMSVMLKRGFGHSFFRWPFTQMDCSSFFFIYPKLDYRLELFNLVKDQGEFGRVGSAYYAP